MSHKRISVSGFISGPEFNATWAFSFKTYSTQVTCFIWRENSAGEQDFQHAMEVKSRTYVMGNRGGIGVNRKEEKKKHTNCPAELRNKVKVQVLDPMSGSSLIKGDSQSLWGNRKADTEPMFEIKQVLLAYFRLD